MIDAFQEASLTANNKSLPFVFIGTCPEIDILKDRFEYFFVHSFGLKLPTVNEREGFINACSQKLHLSSEVNARKLAIHTAGFSFDDYRQVFKMARCLSLDTLLSSL